MTKIHWDEPFFISLKTGETTTPADPNAIAVPTYGNYGGGNYSAGEFGGIPPTNGGLPLTPVQLALTPDPDDDPVDQLDYFSYLHDVAFLSIPTYNQIGAFADLALLNSVVQMDASIDPEMSLYAGFTSIGMIGSITLHGFGGLLLAKPIQLVLAINDAFHDVQYGLSHLPPAELNQALSFYFEQVGPSEYEFDFAIKTKTFGQELVEFTAMNTLNAIVDFGETDNVPLHTGFFPGTTHYALEYNAATGDLDLTNA